MTMEYAYYHFQGFYAQIRYSKGENTSCPYVIGTYACEAWIDGYNSGSLEDQIVSIGFSGTLL